MHRRLSPKERLFSFRPQFQSLDISSLWLTRGAEDQRGENANVGSRKEERALTQSGQAFQFIYPLPSLWKRETQGSMALSQASHRDVISFPWKNIAINGAGGGQRPQ